MKIFLVILLSGICLLNANGQTYTGVFNSPESQGLHTDAWFNLIPNSGTDVANSWNVFHKDGTNRVLGVWYAAALPYVQVGIGRTANLHVNGRLKIASTNDIEFGTDVAKEANAGKIAYQQFSDALDIVGAGTTGTNRKIKFWNEGGASFTGNVGIGTTTPYTWSRLHIKAPGANPWGIMAEASANDKVVALGHDGTTGIITTGYLSGGGPSPLQFRTADLARIAIDINGNVGIGTTDSKGYKLAVAGKAVAEEVNVKLQGNWPDYVFEKEYSLPSLESVQTYINQNKHLPEVPSAKEMEANGINLSEMNMLLLKKVEELTLYVIEQNKRLNQQAELNTAQSILIDELNNEIKNLVPNHKKQ